MNCENDGKCRMHFLYVSNKPVDERLFAAHDVLWTSDLRHNADIGLFVRV